jgi:L-ascorbate metabolism protein UlaG (beta-lactamase superfamily)
MRTTNIQDGPVDDRRRRRRSRVRGTLAVAALAAAGLAWAARDIPLAMGARPRQVRDDRVRRSAQFRDGSFTNPMARHTLPPAAGPVLADAVAPDNVPVAVGHTLREFLFGGQARKPKGPIPVLSSPGEQGADGLHLTWYGHASTLVELDGARVLFDPIWSDRCSPSRLVGPRRLHPTPVALDELPQLDAVVISHDHYDHLDMPTIKALVTSQSAPFVVPLGVGAHLDRWGVPADRIIELDWGTSVELAGLQLTVTPARHFSGRRVTERNYTLWGSWVIAGPTHKVFYTGDSGYFDGYAAIGEQFGPFDAALVQIGAYDPSWPDIHMTPEEGVQAHLDLGARLLVPVHWATFVLAFHAWSDPIDRLWREAKARGVRLAVPRPGERIDAADPPAVDDWWQTIV